MKGSTRIIGFAFRAPRGLRMEASMLRSKLPTALKPVSRMPRALLVLGESLTADDLLEVAWDLAMQSCSTPARAAEALLGAVQDQRRISRRRPLSEHALSQARTLIATLAIGFETGRVPVGLFRAACGCTDREAVACAAAALRRVGVLQRDWKGRVCGCTCHRSGQERC